MNHRSLAFSTMLLALGLGLSTQATGKSDPKAIPIDLAAGPSQLDSVFESTGGGLKDVAKLLISNFRVVLISESDATGTASAGLGASGSASQTVIYKLANLEESSLQTMANSAYQSWQDSFKAAGYEVLAPSVLEGKAGAERLASEANVARFQMIEMSGNIAMMITPQAVPIKLPLGAFATDAHGRKIESAIATSSDAAKVAAAAGKGGKLGKFGAIGGKAVGLTKTVKGMSSVTTAIGDAGTLSKLSQTLGAALVDVTIVINFVDLEASGGGFLERIAGSREASVRGTIQPTFVATETKVALTNGTGGGTLTLKRPLVLSGEAITEVRDATTVVDTAGNITGAVVSGAVALQTGGGVHSSRLTRKEAVASPKYGEVVGDNVELLGAAVAETLRAK